MGGRESGRENLLVSLAYSFSSCSDCAHFTTVGGCVYEEGGGGNTEQ